MTFKIPTSENEFEKYYFARWEILRKPWNQPLGSEKAEDDSKAIHGMLVDKEDCVIAVSRLHYNTTEEAQIRYMGVLEEYRGKGYGMQLLMELEKIAIKQGIKRLMLHSRYNAIPFYKKANYVIAKKSYLLFGEIQHFEMVKSIV